MSAGHGGNILETANQMEGWDTFVVAQVDELFHYAR